MAAPGQQRGGTHVEPRQQRVIGLGAEVVFEKVAVDLRGECPRGPAADSMIFDKAFVLQTLPCRLVAVAWSICSSIVLRKGCKGAKME